MNTKELIILHVLDQYFSNHEGLKTYEHLEEIEHIEFLNDEEIIWEPFEHYDIAELWELIDKSIKATETLIEQVKQLST